MTIESNKDPNIHQPLTPSSYPSQPVKNKNVQADDKGLTEIAKSIKPEPQDESPKNVLLSHQMTQLKADPLAKITRDDPLSKDADVVNDIPKIQNTLQSKAELIKQAIIRGDLAQIKQIMKLPDDIEIRDEINNTPIINAVLYGNADLVRFFVESKANIDARGIYKRTPLMFACLKDNLDIANVLLEHHAKVNEINDDGMSALYYACSNGNDKIVDQLLKEQANPSIAAETGDTPLLIAVYKGHTHVVRLLLTHHADPSMRNNQAYKAIDYAYLGLHFDIVEMLKPYELNENIHTFFTEERILCHRFGLEKSFQTEKRPQDNF